MKQAKYKYFGFSEIIFIFFNLQGIIVGDNIFLLLLVIFALFMLFYKVKKINSYDDNNDMPAFIRDLVVILCLINIFGFFLTLIMLSVCIYFLAYQKAKDIALHF